MATNKKPPVDTGNDEESQSLQEMLADMLTDADSLNPQLEHIYAQVGMTADNADAKVFVSKLDVDERTKEARVWEGVPEQFDLHRVAKTFGSGSYRVMVYMKIPTGQRVRKINEVIAWLLTPEEEAKLKPQAMQQQAGMSAQDIATIINTAMDARMPREAQPANQMANLKELAEIMSLLQGNRPEPPPAKDPIAAMRDMVEIAQMLKGGDDAPLERGVNANGMDLLNNLIVKFGPLLTGALQTMQVPMAEAAAPQLAAPQPTHMPMPAAPATQPQPTEQDEMNLRLMMGIQFLKNGCAQGGNAESYADMVIDNVPAEAIADVMKLPDPLQYFAQHDATLLQEPYATWFRAVIDECRELLKPEEGPSPAA